MAQADSNNPDPSDEAGDAFNLADLEYEEHVPVEELLGEIQEIDETLLRGLEEVASDPDMQRLTEDVDDAVGAAESPAGSDDLPEDEPPTSPESSEAAEPPIEAAASSTSTPEQAAADDALRALDEELAEDVDQLLQGDFQSIDEVLDGVFEEKAALVQEPVAAPNSIDHDLGANLESPAPDPMQPAAGDEPGEEEAASAESYATPPASSDPPAEPIADDIEPTAPEARVDDDQAADDQLPHDHEDPDHAIDGVEANDPRSETSGPFDSLDDHHDDDIDTGDPETGTTGLAGSLAAGCSRAVSPWLVTPLIWINAPLRILPTALRPIVDWIAISLIFWVPIVWVIALLVIGR